MTATMTVTTPSDTEITLQRTFDAPRALVYECMTRPEHIREWWGWSHWTMTVCEGSFEPGGTYRFEGRSPDGDIVAFRGQTLEADPPARIRYTELYDVAPFNEGPPSIVTATFEEVDGRTTVTVTSLFDNRQTRDFVIGTGMEQGASHSYDRLEALLKRLASA